MPFDAPFRLGPFGWMPRVGFRRVHGVAGVPVPLPRSRGAIAFGAGGWHGGPMTMQTVVGRVPSTADTEDETLRPRSFVLLHWLSRAVPEDWQMSLSPDHRVSLTTEVPVELPITAAALVQDHLLRVGTGAVSGHAG